MALVLLVLGFLTSAIYAPVSAASSFTGTASARLIGVDMRTAPAIIFDPILDGGTSVAQAQVDSLGTSNAFASMPYPSASVVQLPGLAAGLTAGKTSGLIPEYPFIANSTYPSKATDRRALGPVALEATSRPDGSHGLATDGISSSTADVSHDAASDEIVARAETSIDLVRLSDQLSISGLHSLAVVRKKSSGTIVRTTEFDIAAITVAGHRIALNHAQLNGASGALVPVLTALASQGTKIEPFPATTTDDGVIAAGLRITRSVAPPTALASGVSEVAVTYTVGGNSASVTNRVFGGNLLTSLPSLSADTASGFTNFAASAAPISAALGPIATAAPTVLPDSTRSASGRISAVSPAISVASVYPVLVFAGAALFGLIEVFRRRGVARP